jgi:MFS family permease
MQTSAQTGTIETTPAFPNRNYFFVAVYWFAISLLWGGFLSVVLPVFNEPFAIQVFGVNQIETARGIMSALGIIIAMFVQPMAGAMSDVSTHPYGRRRPYMIGGTIGVLISLVLIVISGNWWMLLVGYLLLQLTDNVSQGSYQGLMPDVVPEDKRGKASAFLAISQLSGTLVGAVLPGILQSSLGELLGSQIMLVIIGLGFVVSLALTCLFIKERQFRPTQKIGAWSAAFGMFRGLHHYPDFNWLMVSRFIFLTAPASVSLFVKRMLEGTADTTSPYYGLAFVRPTADAQTGLVTPQAGTTLSIILGIVVLTAILASYPFSVLSERTGRKRMIYLATIIGFVGGVGLLVPHLMIQNAAETAQTLAGFEAQQAYMDNTRPLATIIAIVFGSCIGSSWGAFLSVDWAYATDLIPLDEAGRFMGLTNIATAGCQAAAAFIGGFIVDSTLGLTGLYVSVCLYFVLSAVFLTRVRETRGKALVRSGGQS